MGKNLHVCKRVEDYGNTSVFSYTYNDFADLLCKYGCDVHYDNEGENLDRFECDKQDFIDALDKFKAMLNADVNKEDMAEFEALGGLSMVITNMEAYLNECDPDSNDMVFVAW